MSSSSFEEEAFEQTLCQVRTVHVFKIPPRMTSGGYRAGDWKDEVWAGALKVVQKGMACAILLTDPKTNQLFAMCPVAEGAVERCVDSSRYFVLKIQNAQGRHAFIGVAFNEREEAFDFNVALQEYEKDKEREQKLRDGTYEAEAANAPKLDLSIKDGQKIAIKLPTRVAPDGTPLERTERKPRSASGGGASASLLGGGGGGGGGGLLPPPPGVSGGLLAPPPSATAARKHSPAPRSDSLLDDHPTASSSSSSSSGSSFPSSGGFMDAPANPQPPASSGFSAFGSFDPLAPAPTAVGGHASGSGASGGSKQAAPLDDWAALSTSLPQASRPAQPPSGGMKPPGAASSSGFTSSASDPFADLLK